MLVDEMMFNSVLAGHSGANFHRHNESSYGHHNTAVGQNLARLQSRLAPRSNWLGESAMLDHVQDQRMEEVLIIVAGALLATSLAVVYSLFA
jgi:hypothetical protein